MTQAPGQTSPPAGPGKEFFDRADQVAGTGNWDFAIELYLEGISREPDNVERGHQLLYQAALNRKAQGGKPAGLIEQLKRRAGKDQVENLINAEYLMAKDPTSSGCMVQVLEAVRKLGLSDVVRWIGRILLETQRQEPKRNKRILLTLTQALHDAEEYAWAVQACLMARELSPNDAALARALQELMAKDTIKKGQYDKGGDFTKGVKDMKGQKELMEKDALVKSQDYLQQQVDKARGEYRQSPAVIGKVLALVDALLKYEEDAYENEAIEVLTKAHRDTGAYQFKMRIGDVKMRQMTRHRRALVSAGDRKAAETALREQVRFELQEYAERVANYPTDLSLKYELGRRQLAAGQLDDAIGNFQQAQRDPVRHVRALNYLGQAFSRKGWLREAADTLERALQVELSEDQSKEIRYSLGDVYEKMNDLEKAQNCFSEVAQLDYNFRDARQRLEAVRKKLPGAQGS